MALTSAQKMKSFLNLVINRDDGKMQRNELEAALALGRGKNGKLGSAAVTELVGLYKQGDSLFEGPDVRKALRSALVSSGAVLPDIGIDPKNTSPELQAFFRLSEDEKVKRLYPGYEKDAEYGNFELSSEFSGVPVKLATLLEGETLSEALAAYRRSKTASNRNGGGSPEVRAIVKGDVIFGYQFYCRGRSQGDWGHTEVFARDFKALGEFGWSD